MKVLITGGSGMVGRNLLEHSEILKNKVYAPTRKDLNLLNYSTVKNYLKKIKPDFIVHCAGRVGGIQANINSPVEFLIENLEIGKNLVTAAQLVGIPSLINLGSSCMYPKDLNGPISEDKLLTGVLEPTNEGYALSKIVVARLCSYINLSDDKLSYKTIIPCNLYGKYDLFNSINAHLIPAIISKINSAMIHNETSVEIWGNGEARREFMYSGDLADFIAYAISKYDDMPELLNVGIGTDYTINEYYKKVADTLGFQGEFIHDLSRAVGMQRKLTDITRVNNFGWRSSTGLSDGLVKTFQYFKEEIDHV